MPRSRTPRPALPDDVERRLADYLIGGHTHLDLIVNLLDALDAETIRATELEVKYHHTAHLLAQATLTRLKEGSDE